MSLFGKILAVLNVLVAIAFLVLAGMDYSKRHSWSYAHFRHQVAIHGLPVADSDETWRLPGRTISNDLSKRTLDELFTNAGGDAPKTQVEAVEQIKIQILRGAADKADDQAKKNYFSGYLVPLAKTGEEREIYQQYDDREQRDWETRFETVLDRGRITVLPFKEVRRRYVDYLCQELQAPGRILEVGCGNCINLIELKARYGDTVELHGLDYTPERLKVARRYFGSRLNGVALHEGSITQPTQWPDGYFDFVFSMHCIEQISYQTHAAVAEMARLARRGVVMIEPVFELANAAQKLYLINADHVRILLRAIRDVGLNPRRVEALDIQSNPVCQSSIVVIDRNLPVPHLAGRAGTRNEEHEISSPPGPS